MIRRIVQFLAVALLVALVVISYNPNNAANVGQSPVSTPEITPEITPEAEATQEPQPAPEAQPVSEALTPAELCAAAVPAPDPVERTFSQAEQVLMPGVDYRAIFCTSAGAIYIDLLEEHTPITVNNFVFLAENGYYNNTIFHRVIENFMAQGGDPTATGTGGPGYRFEDEFVGFLTFDSPGWLAMANAGPGTNGSQFFITTVPTPHLNFRHTIFGEVLEGQEVVRNIQLRDPQQANAPATDLQTVIIITDPDMVRTTYIAPEPASREQVINGIADVAQLVDEAIGLRHVYTVIEADEIASQYPESLRDDFNAFVDAYNLQYRVTSLVENFECDVELYPFVNLGYVIDVYATREDATNALNDGLLAQAALASGFEAANDDGTEFFQSITNCANDASSGIIYTQRGRFVITATAETPADPAFTVFQIIEFISQRVHETVLAELLLLELR